MKVCAIAVNLPVAPEAPTHDGPKVLEHCGLWEEPRPPARARFTADGENERAGRRTGHNKTECGIPTFMTKKVDFQI